jgi:multimeric flavodoxin WrbA/putative sterol carrier protein
MKRVMGILPHVIITVYVTLLSIGTFGPSGLKGAGVAGLLLMAGSVLFARRGGSGVSPVIKGYILYFVLNVIVFWAPLEGTARALSTNPTAFLYGCLCAITVLPAIFARQYFTEYFARKTTPSAAWQTVIFKTINRNMTWIWAAIFAVCMMIALAPDLLSLPGSLFTSLLVQVALPMLLMLLVGVPFNKRYPVYYQKKMGIKPVDIGPAGSHQTPVEPVPEIEEITRKEEIMSNQLKVVAVNGSPHAGIGNASIMIQMMKPVLAQEGIDLEEVFIAGKRIEYCVGCGVCMEKGKCWRQDDHAGIIAKILDADGVILASPVYFRHVTAQMKTFLDRSLAYGHKPRTAWKPGLAISVSAGMGETNTADYLAGCLRVYGAFSVGTFTAIAVNPGSFLGIDLVEARARDVALDLARAIKEKRRYPATENDLFFYLFMGDLIRRQKDFMTDDYRHWEESGFYKGFEAYVGQNFAVPPVNDEMRKEWIRDMISREVGRVKERAAEATTYPPKPQSAETCGELLRTMPLGFRKEAAGNLKAVYQFQISGTENFTAHLTISEGTCVCADGPHEKPDVIVKAPAAVWLAISKGEMDGQAAFLAGKYTVEGNITLLMKLSSLFGS